MKRATLRRRIHALLVRWFLLYLALSALALALAYPGIKDAAVEERLLLARALARHLDSSISELHHHLRSLTVEADFFGGKSLERLRSCRLQHLFRDAIYVLDHDAVLVMSDPPRREILAAADLRRREAVTPLLTKELDGRPFVALSQPFRIDRADYHVVAEMDLPGAALGALLGDLTSGADLRLFLIDARGRVLASPDPAQLFRAVPGGEEIGRRITAHRSFIDLDIPGWSEGNGGSRVTTFMVPLELAPWGVVLQQPYPRVFAAVYAARDTFLLTLVLLLGAGVLLSWALSRTVVSPIRELSEQAELLRGGELDHTIDVAGDHEIEVLAHTLDAARQKLVETFAELRRLNEGLEEEVAQRTAETEKLLAEALARDAERRTLVRRLLGAGEEERRRIARELHDEISQLLTVVQLSLDDLDDAPSLLKARNLLTKTQKELHRLIYDLRPSLLDDLGLPAAVKWYAENYLLPRGIRVSLEVEEDVRMTPEVEITAFRIYQEILTNILRHSQAEHVAIELYRDHGRWVLAVEDDGIGFAVDRKVGAGIVGMRERADIVHGRLRIDSAPNTGTQVIVELPLAWTAAAPIAGEAA